MRVSRDELGRGAGGSGSEAGGVPRAEGRRERRPAIPSCSCADRHAQAWASPRLGGDAIDSKKPGRLCLA